MVDALFRNHSVDFILIDTNAISSVGPFDGHRMALHGAKVQDRFKIEEEVGRSTSSSGPPDELNGETSAPRLRK